MTKPKERYLVVVTSDEKPHNRLAIVANLADAQRFANTQQLEEPDGSAEESSIKTEETDELSKSYKSLMSGLSNVVMQSYNLAETAEFFGGFISHLVDNDVISKAKALSEPVDAGADYQIYKLDEPTFKQVNKKLSLVSRFEAAATFMPSSVLLSLAARFDSFMCDVVAATIRHGPNKSKINQRSISLAEIVTIGSLEDAISKVLMDELYEFQRGSHAAQVEYIEKNFNVALRKDWSRWPAFIEIFERRNLVAHGVAVVSQRYVDACGNQEGNDRVLANGNEILVDSEYLEHCVDILTEFSILMLFSLWRKSSKSNEPVAVAEVHNIAYDLMKARHTVAAERVLSYMLSLTKLSCEELIRRMMTVNLALCQKRLSKSKDMERTLSSMDWSASADEFKIAVAAVRDQDEIVLDLMKRAADSGAVSKFAFRTWPVFEEIRKNKKFREKFAEIFGEPLFTGISKKSDADHTVAPVDAPEPEAVDASEPEATVH